jgi:hypothetical protein
MARADTPQKLSATVDGKLFESDDDSIMYLLPRPGVFNLIASTKGSATYPPPKTPVDRLSINCNNFLASRASLFSTRRAARAVKSLSPKG